MAHFLARTSVVAVIALLACKDETVSSAGTPSDVTVRVYVDADGSANFTTGDAPVAGQPVQLTSATASGATFNATTDEQGVATFAAVPPGTYSAVFAGSAPVGAVLATAAEAAVTAPFGGGTLTAEFRFVYFPGSLAATLFRDENGNGTYDAGTDTPGFGVRVSLFAGAAVSTDTVATAITGLDGVFAFGALRPGPYTLVLRHASGIQFVGGTPRSIEVPPAAPATVDARFTGSLVAPIRQAKLDSGVIVQVEGVVTVARGTLNAASAYVQDTSTGVQLFNLPTTLPLAVGDSVRATGIMGAFAGEREIVRFNTTTPPVVAPLGTGTVPAPRTVTGTEIVARTFEGQLAAIANVQLTVKPASATGAYNLTFLDAATTTSFVSRIEGSVVTAVPLSFWTLNNCYNLTGVLSVNNTTAQLKPRGSADITSVVCP